MYKYTVVKHFSMPERALELIPFMKWEATFRKKQYFIKRKIVAYFSKNSLCRI
jgi:hypothetical protein